MGDEARKYALRHFERNQILRRFELCVLETCGYASRAVAAETLISQDMKLARVEDFTSVEREVADG
jgi:hypothetical protein